MASLLRSRRAWIVAVATIGVVVTVFILSRGAAPSRGVLVRLDPEQPYQILFGRGSGWHGLDTVKVHSGGTVTLQRSNLQANGWESATLKLPKGALAELVGAVEENRLLALNREYRKEGIADGTASSHGVSSSLDNTRARFGGRTGQRCHAAGQGQAARRTRAADQVVIRSPAAAIGALACPMPACGYRPAHLLTCAGGELQGGSQRVRAK
jgi:hypothetical protein